MLCPGKEMDCRNAKRSNSHSLEVRLLKEVPSHGAPTEEQTGVIQGKQGEEDDPGKCQPRDKGASLEIKKYSYNAGAQDRKGGMVLRLER